MIGFLKRWFATKSEVESVYSQLDTIAHAIQELRKDQLMRRDAELNDWRPEVALNFKRSEPAKPVIVEALDHSAKSPTSEHYARMSVRVKGTMENRLIDIASDRMRGIGCSDVSALRRRIKEETAHLCISSRQRTVKRSKGAKNVRTYAGDMRFYDRRTVNQKGNNPEKTYVFRCEEERLLLEAYFDIHKVPYSTGRKQ